MTSQEQQPKLVLRDRCLAVFVDDTGHEALVREQPVYGLGGCAALGRDIERLIHQPWKELRRRVSRTISLFCGMVYLENRFR